MRNLKTKDLKTKDVNSEMIDKDNPEWSDEMFAHAKRGSYAVKLGRPKLDNPKQRTTIRLSSEVIDFFKSSGKGWQTRVNEILMDYVSSNK